MHLLGYLRTLITTTLHIKTKRNQSITMPVMILILAVITFYRTSKTIILCILLLFYLINNQPRIYLSKD